MNGLELIGLHIWSVVMLGYIEREYYIMNGWIIHKNHEVKRLVEEFENQGVKIRVVNPQDVDIFVDRDDRKSIIVDGVPRKLPDFVLPRTGSGTTYFIINH